jgi:hypothetical protein
MDSLVKKYIIGHLSLKTNGKTVVLKYLGFEKENEAVYSYFEADNVLLVNKIDVTNSILYDLYDDQISIIHVVVEGNRKSTKLDYPHTQTSFNF